MNVEKVEPGDRVAFVHPRSRRKVTGTLHAHGTAGATIVDEEGEIHHVPHGQFACDGAVARLQERIATAVFALVATAAEQGLDHHRRQSEDRLQVEVKRLLALYGPDRVLDQLTSLRTLGHLERDTGDAEVVAFATLVYAVSWNGLALKSIRSSWLAPFLAGGIFMGALCVFLRWWW